MTDIDEDEVLDIDMRYCYDKDEINEELEIIKMSKEYYNAQKLAYLSGLNVDPLELIYVLTEVEPDKTYSDDDFIDVFFNAKKFFCDVAHLYGGTNEK